MDSQEIRGRMAKLHRSLETKSADLIRLETKVGELGKELARQAASNVRTGIVEADRWLEQEQRALDESSRTATAAALRHVQESATGAAPGPLGWDWSAPEWANPGVVGSLGEAIRVGHFSGRLDGVASVAPVVRPGLWLVDAGPEDFWALQSSMLLRLIAAYGPGGVRSRTWDPSFQSYTGAFSALDSLDDACVPSAISDETEFATAVDELLKKLRVDCDALLARGYATVADALSAGDVAGVPMRVLFVGGPPPSRDDRIGPEFERLIAAAANQNLLVVALTSAMREVGLEDPAGARGSLQLAVSASDGGLAIGGLPGFPVVFEPGPKGRELVELVRILANRKIVRRLPTLPLMDLMAQDPFEKWIDEGTEGIEAVIGQAGSRPLTIGLRSSNPPTPNCLIGGAVGQGKTNVLLALIHSLADRYSPADLEMVLLDLKDGVEFNVLGPGPDGRGWLPHLRSLGLAFDIDYILAVLTWATGELERRNTLFRQANVSSLAAYRRVRSVGLPRIVIVIDEFHRMFEVEDDRSTRAVGLLEHLSRTGRSAGVHMVLSSQTTSGIPALAAKSSAIFTQYHTRISLKNSPEESQAILAPGNVAAAELEYPGEVIVNDDMGRPERNVRGLAAYASDLELRNLREKLFRQGSGAPPSIFDAQAPAVWDVGRMVELAGDSGSGLVTSPGRLVSLENDPELLRIPRATGNLGVIGSDRKLVHSVVGSLLLSSVALAQVPMDITVLNGLAQHDPSTPWLISVVEELRRLGSSVRIVGETGVADWIGDLAADPGRAMPGLVVPLVIDRIPALSRPGDDFRTPMENFGDLMVALPRGGATVVGWWDSMAPVSGASLQPNSLFHTVFLAGASIDDVRTLCGPFHAGTSNPWRAIVVSPGAPGSARTVVPYDPVEMGLLP